MTCRVLVVEDEIFVAIGIENMVIDLGYEPVGIAADSISALKLASQSDVALVDLNLQDGATGPDLGRRLAQDHGITVIYITANPAQLGRGIPGTLGVLSKPVNDDELRSAVNYAVSNRQNGFAAPPARPRIFN